jgi:hypothetical protein
MIHSFTVTFGAKHLTGMVTSVPPYEIFSLIKKNILRQSKIYKNHFENSNFWGMWPLGHVGHVTYSFIHMLFISTGIFDDKLRPQSLSVGTTANSPLRETIPLTRPLSQCIAGGLIRRLMYFISNQKHPWLNWFNLTISKSTEDFKIQVPSKKI